VLWDLPAEEIGRLKEAPGHRCRRFKEPGGEFVIEKQAIKRAFT
jgi:hypothetical protein